jgi:Glyoxalase-like domain
MRFDWLRADDVSQAAGGSRIGLRRLNLDQEKEGPQMTLGFGQVVIDSQRADDIASFWSTLLERPVMDGANQFVAMVPASEDRSFPALMFLAVPEPRQGKNRVHLDLVATDIQAEVERAISLGATKVADFDEYGTRWTTMTDPEGNVFDVGLPPSRG